MDYFSNSMNFNSSVFGRFSAFLRKLSIMDKFKISFRRKQGCSTLSIIFLLSAVVLLLIYVQERHISEKESHLSHVRVNVKVPHEYFAHNLCDKNTKFLVLVLSKLRDFQWRRLVRASFGQCAQWKYSPYRLLFYFGEFARATKPTLDQLQEEMSSFGDMVWDHSFVDNYANYTRKSVNALQWIHENCAGVKYVVKIDNDMLLFIDRLVRQMYTTLKNYGLDFHGKNVIPPLPPLSKEYRLFGLFHNNTSPDRSQTSKFYVSMEEYSQSKYPIYADGSLYVMSGALLQPIVNSLRQYESQNPKSQLLHIEDAFVTGVLLDGLVGVSRLELTDVCLRECNQTQSTIAINAVSKSKIISQSTVVSSCLAMFDEILDLVHL